MFCLTADCPAGKYQDLNNQPSCKSAQLPHKSGAYEAVTEDGTTSIQPLITGLDGQPYDGPAYEYEKGVLAALGLMCSSIRDQCDQGPNGAPCEHGGTPSGQRNQTCEESAACRGTTADARSPHGDSCGDNNDCKSDICVAGVCEPCAAYLVCRYADCSCTCLPGYYDEYCQTRTLLLAGQTLLYCNTKL